MLLGFAAFCRNAATEDVRKDLCGLCDSVAKIVALMQSVTASLA
jgi:hypothetical protein